MDSGADADAVIELVLLFSWRGSLCSNVIDCARGVSVAISKGRRKREDSEEKWEVCSSMKSKWQRVLLLRCRRKAIPSMVKMLRWLYPIAPNRRVSKPTCKAPCVYSSMSFYPQMSPIQDY